MTFTKELLSFDSLPSETTEKGRLYRTPKGKAYPSVTTVLSKRPEKMRSLQEWRNRVGEDEANRISSFALKRGTHIDKLLEDYLLGQQYLPGMMPLHELIFTKMKKKIDENLDKIYGVKVPLYSDTLRIAGEADLIGSWKGVNSIIDNKTARNEKRKEYIEDYFLQTTMYSLMFEERTSIKCPQIVILIGCDDTPEAQVFAEPKSSFERKAKQIIADFYNE